MSLSARAPGASLGRNPLLMRDDVGRSKFSCYDLPHENFAYGRPGHVDAEGAREVSQQWASHVQSLPPQEDMSYLHFHGKATGSKVANAKDLKYFKREHAAMPRSARAHSHSGAPRVLQNKMDMLPRDLPNDFTFGRKVRPSTPVHDVVSHHFARQAEHDLAGFYSTSISMREVEKTHVRKIPLTNASRGHASTAKKAQEHSEARPELFKIGKFRRATSKVDHHRRKELGLATPRYDVTSVSDGGSADSAFEENYLNDADSALAATDAPRLRQKRPTGSSRASSDGLP